MTQAHSFARSSLRRLLVSAFALSSARCTVTAFGSSTVTISGSPLHTSTAGLDYSFTPTTNDTARDYQAALLAVREEGRGDCGGREAQAARHPEKSALSGAVDRPRAPRH